MMPDSEYQKFRDDIRRANKLTEPEITTYEGKILDGRHRYRACIEVGIEPTFKAFTGSLAEARAFVISQNLYRRHLDESQRAMVAARLANLSHGVRQDRSIELSISQPQAAEMLSVSVPSIKRARAVLERGASELIKAVDDGIIAVSVAADLTELPGDEQRRVVADAVTNRFAASNAAREVKRNERIGDLIQAGTPTLDGLGKFAIIVADPPWTYEFPVSDSRDIQNHYPVMSLEEICDLPVADLALPDSILYLWVPPPKVADAIRVLDAWEFNCRSSAVWDKGSIGMGKWFRQQHELILLATRGTPPTPPPKTLISSVIRAPRGAHSTKPEIFYKHIDAMYPKLRKLEMFARNKHPGSTAWGNEANQADEILKVGAK